MVEEERMDGRARPAELRDRLLLDLGLDATAAERPDLAARGSTSITAPAF